MKKSYDAEKQADPRNASNISKSADSTQAMCKLSVEQRQTTLNKKTMPQLCKFWYNFLMESSSPDDPRVDNIVPATDSEKAAALKQALTFCIEHCFRRGDDKTISVRLIMNHNGGILGKYCMKDVEWHAVFVKVCAFFLSLFCLFWFRSVYAQCVGNFATHTPAIFPPHTQIFQRFFNTHTLPFPIPFTHTPSGIKLFSARVWARLHRRSIGRTFLC